MLSHRIRSLMLLLVVWGSLVCGQDGRLDSWQSNWSPYRLIDDAGIERRLVKATIEFKEATTAGWSLVLAASNDEALIESVPPDKKGVWPHGFWIPKNATTPREYWLELRNLNRTVATRTVTIAGARETETSLPLRLDRMNRGLLRRLETREAASGSDTQTDVLS